MGCEAQATGRGKRETSVVGTELPYQHQTWTPGGRPARSAAAAERGRGGVGSSAADENTNNTHHTQK